MKSAKIKKLFNNYFFLFIVTICIIMSSFFINGRSFIWYGSAGDGLVQHYTAFVYYGEYLRKILYNFFVSNTFQIPLWDSHVGFGSDIVTTFNCYILGDPLGILSVFFPPKFAEFGFNLLVILRFFLSGLSFLLYCRYMKLNKQASLIGAFVYIFSGYGLYAGVKHPYFMNVMIYLPLILIGIEKIFQKKKPYLFIFMIFLSAFSNFYFFYMLSLIMFIYAVFRYLLIFKKIKIKILIHFLGIFIFYYLIGLCLSSFTFFPSAMSILNSSRIGIETYLPMFYNQNYYWNIYSSFISSGSASYWTVLSFSFISFLCLIVLFLRKRYFYLKIVFILFAVMLCIPYFGHIFNGLSYFTNRFIWSFTFIVSIITVIILPEIYHLKKKEKISIIIVEIIYFIMCMVNPLGLTLSTTVSIVYMILSTIFFFSLNQSYRYYFLICSVNISLVINAYFRYSPNQMAFVNQFISTGKAYAAMTQVPSQSVSLLEDKSFYRYDENGKLSQEPFNTSLFSHLNSTSFYFSTINSNITKFLYEDLYYTGNRTEIKYSGLDSRTFLEALFNVKYYVINQDSMNYLPYGFTNIISTYQNDTAKYNLKKKELPQFHNQGNWNVVENNYYVPFGFTYDTYILQEDFDKLSVQKKQEALMQSVVVDEKPKGLNENHNQYSSEICHYYISNVEGMKQIGNDFELTDSEGLIELTFDSKKDCEIYLILKGVTIEEESPLEMYQNNVELWSQLSKKEQNQIIDNYRFYQSDGRYFVQTQCLNVEKKLGIFMQKAESYSGFKNFLVNYGYAEEERNKITLRFNQAGKYHFEDIQIIAQPMDNYEEYVQKMSKNHLENVIINDNQISGNITLDYSKMLCLSIPYSDSWEVYIDGEKSHTQKINEFMLGILLEPGNHNIQLYYRMPYKLPIFILTTLGVIGVVGIYSYDRRKKKSKVKKKIYY